VISRPRLCCAIRIFTSLAGTPPVFVNNGHPAGCARSPRMCSGGCPLCEIERNSQEIGAHAPCDDENVDACVAASRTNPIRAMAKSVGAITALVQTGS